MSKALRSAPLKTTSAAHSGPSSSSPGKTKVAAREVQLVVNRFERRAAPSPQVRPVAERRRRQRDRVPAIATGATSSGRPSSVTAAPPAAIAIGAVRYNDAGKPERFSSRGPVTHYFGPVIGPAPAAATGAADDRQARPGGHRRRRQHLLRAGLQAGLWRFFGTSAAAPHAAAVAALVRQANPGASAALVRAALVASARPVGAFGPSAVGAGLIDAFGAVAALALPPKVTITEGASAAQPRPPPGNRVQRQPAGRLQLPGRRRARAAVRLSVWRPGGAR